MGPSASSIEIETSRFGRLALPRDRIITFENGLPGSPDARAFCLLGPREDPLFFWLQSTQKSDLAFAVTDPSLFIDGYINSLHPPAADLSKIGLQRAQDGLIFVIVNKQDGYLTGNLTRPLIVNGETKQGIASILDCGVWGTRARLLRG